MSLYTGLVCVNLIKIQVAFREWDSKHRCVAPNLAVTFGAAVASFPEDARVTCRG